MSQRRASSKSAAAANANSIPADLSFEEAFAQMQEAIAQLETGDLPLDATVSTFERGMRLAQHCTALLDGAELHVQTLEEQVDGTLVLRDIVVETE
jgi:exodeoxyribonuclease VII small subunit